MSAEPESLVLQILRHMRAELAELRAEFRTEVSDLRSKVADVKSDMHSLRADVTSDLMTTRRELTDQIVGLRRAVVDYHTSVIGHGVLISDLEARMRRVEQHLNLSSPVAG